MSFEEYKLCPRPGIGKKGKPVTAIGNFYGMRLPDITIYQYDVKISPELEKRDLDKARPASLPISLTNLF